MVPVLASASLPAPYRRAPSAPAWRRGARLVLLSLALLVGGTALLGGFAAAYTVKRRLGIDVVRGVDMLPDPQIEAAIAAVLHRLGHPRA